MGWVSSLVVALFSGLTGLLLGGVIANRAADWYQVSSFEGKAGYFVVLMALFGLIGGAVVGVVAARIVAAGSDPSFLRALAFGVGSVVLACGAIAAVARFLADVPQQIADEEPRTLRVDQVGPFVVETFVAGSAPARFRVSHHDQPLPEFADAGAVAVVGGTTPALLVQVGTTEGNQHCRLVREDTGQVRIEAAGVSAAPVAAFVLTADPARYRAALELERIPGSIDTKTFATPGLYEVGHGVLDTRDFAFRPVTAPDGPWRFNGLPPASLSPDERSFVWFTHDGDAKQPRLGVTDWRADAWYTVAIDRDRMRYLDEHDIDPAWVAHHFSWVREGDIDRLRPREHFAPIPHRGARVKDAGGALIIYILRPGGRALRQAIVDTMVAELGAERLADELDGYHYVLRLDDKLVKVATGGTGGGVSFALDYGARDPAVLEKVARHLDAAIAGGAYDALFRDDS